MWRSLRTRSLNKRNPLEARVVGSRLIEGVKQIDGQSLILLEEMGENYHRKYGVDPTRPGIADKGLKYVRKHVAHDPGGYYGSGFQGLVAHIVVPTPRGPEDAAVKITNDPYEAAAALALMRNGNTIQNFPHIYGVFQIEENGQFAIFREELPAGLHKIWTTMAADLLFSEVTTDADGFPEVWNWRRPRSPETVARRQRELVESLEADDPRVDEFLSRWLVYAEGLGSPKLAYQFEPRDIARWHMAMQDYGLLGVWEDYLGGLALARALTGLRFYDLHQGNLRARDRSPTSRLVVSDLGYAAVERPTQVPIVNPRRRKP